MKAIIHQYEEVPLILEDVESIEQDGNDLTIVNYEGTITFNIEDVMRVELTNN